MITSAVSGKAMRARIAIRALEFLLGLENLPAAIRAGLEVDMVRPPELAGLLVLNPGRLLDLVPRPAHADAAAGQLLSWDGHWSRSINKGALDRKSRGAFKSSPRL